MDSHCYCEKERIYLLIYSVLFNNITVVGAIDCAVSITPIPMWASGGRATVPGGHHKDWIDRIG